MTVRTASTAPPGAAPVSPSTPLGMSTASTGRPGRVGWPVLAVEAGAEGGVDHEVAGGERVGRLGHGDDDGAHPPAPQQAGGLAAVVAVVALAGHDDHPPPVGAAEQVEGLAGHGRRGPPDEDLDGLGRLGVDRAHLVGGQDRLHAPPRLTVSPAGV